MISLKLNCKFNDRGGVSQTIPVQNTNSPLIYLHNHVVDCC